MIIRNLDSNHDWVFGHGKQDYISGDAAIGLNINTRLLSWLNDCFFDINAGVDWLNRLGSLNQKDLLDRDLRRIIQQSYGVTGLKTLFVTLSAARMFNATYNITTIFSPSYQNTLKQDLSNAG